MKYLLGFLMLFCYTCAVYAEKALVLAAVETPDERAEPFFSDISLQSPNDAVWGDSEALRLARFQRLAAHQQEVYARHAKTPRGRALLLARDVFTARLLQKIGSKVPVYASLSTCPQTSDITFIRLVVHDSTVLREAPRTIRTQYLTVSVERPDGQLLFSAPISAVSVKTGEDTAAFDELLLRQALEQAADRVAAYTLCQDNPAAAKPTYAIDATVWNPASAQITICRLTKHPLSPTVSSLLPNLQPNTLYNAEPILHPIDGTLLDVHEETIAGETVKNQCARLRAALFNACKAANLPVVMRGRQSDAARSAQGIKLPERTLTLTLLTYSETYSPAQSTTLPLAIQGRLELNAQLTIQDRATGDTLEAVPIKITLPIAAALDEANSETVPFPPVMALDLLANRAAETLQSLHN